MGVHLATLDGVLDNHLASRMRSGLDLPTDTAPRPPTVSSAFQSDETLAGDRLWSGCHGNFEFPVWCCVLFTWCNPEFWWVGGQEIFRVARSETCLDHAFHEGSQSMTSQAQCPPAMSVPCPMPHAPWPVPLSTCISADIPLGLMRLSCLERCQPAPAVCSCQLGTQPALVALGARDPRPSHEQDGTASLPRPTRARLPRRRSPVTRIRPIYPAGDGKCKSGR